MTKTQKYNMKAESKKLSIQKLLGSVIAMLCLVFVYGCEKPKETIEDNVSSEQSNVSTWKCTMYNDYIVTLALDSEKISVSTSSSKYEHLHLLQEGQQLKKIEHRNKEYFVFSDRQYMQIYGSDTLIDGFEIERVSSDSMELYYTQGFGTPIGYYCFAKKIVNN